MCILGEPRWVVLEGSPSTRLLGDGAGRITATGTATVTGTVTATASAAATAAVTATATTTATVCAGNRGCCCGCASRAPPTCRARATDATHVMAARQPAATGDRRARHVERAALQMGG